MKQYILKTLIFIFILLGYSQQGVASGIPLEELGIYKDPDTGKYVFEHVDHYPTAAEMAIAEGLYNSARTQLRKHRISGLGNKPDIRRAIILNFKAAAYYGHRDAMQLLADSLAMDWSGQKKYESDAASAVRRSEAKDIWNNSKSFIRRGKAIPDRRLDMLEDVQIIDKIMEARRKAEEERKEAEEAARRAEEEARTAAAAGAVDDADEEESKREDVPLLGGLRHRPPKATGHLDEEGLTG
jgi:hypothetical protein